MNRKDDASLKALTRKPTRFNLGGLIKKKITWKRTIDSLVPPELPLASQLKHSHHDLENSAFPSYAVAATAADAGETLDFSRALLSSAAPHDRYTSFNTECILLQNSDMTSHLGLEDDAWDALLLLCRLSEAPLEPISYDPNCEESARDYVPGGYHPVKLGDSYYLSSDRYRVVRKLGWGHFSTVWLCVLVTTRKYVALKIVKLGSNYADAARDEIKILRGLQHDDTDNHDSHGFAALRSSDSYLVCLLDNFVIHGPNGAHIAMVFELMGENLLHLIYKCKAACFLPHHTQLLQQPRMGMIKLVVHQVLLLVHAMHCKGVIHTDLKPENILLAHDGLLPDDLRWPKVASSRHQILPSQPLKISLADILRRPIHVKVADLGNATYSSLHFTNHIQTRQYRAPEIILRHGCWGALADVWSVGCIIFELLTGDFLFDPNDGPAFSKDEDHLAQIIELLGEFPSSEYLSRCENALLFFLTPKLLMHIRKLKFWSLEDVLAEKYRFDLSDPNVLLLCDLIRKCLRYDLHSRYDCGSLLAHPWFHDNSHYDDDELSSLPNHNDEIVGFTCEE